MMLRLQFNNRVALSSCNRRIIGWMIFIYTLIHIYNVIMRKSESGV